MINAVRKLNWNDNGYDNFDLHVISAPGDGHCMIHSIANACFTEYRFGTENNIPLSRYKIVKKIREGIANRLERIDPDTGSMLYDTIGNGSYKELALFDEQYSLKSIQAKLRSNEYLGIDTLSFLEKYLNKDIFILDANTKDVYIRDEMPSYDSAIVIYYTYDYELGTGHFDTISLYDGKCHITHFSKNNPFIKFITNRIKLKK